MLGPSLCAYTHAECLFTRVSLGALPIKMNIEEPRVRVHRIKKHFKATPVSLRDLEPQ